MKYGNKIFFFNSVKDRENEMKRMKEKKTLEECQ